MWINVHVLGGQYMPWEVNSTNCIVIFTFASFSPLKKSLYIIFFSPDHQPPDQAILHFGIETKVQNITGPESYGLYFSLYGLVFTPVHQWPCIQNYNTIFVAQNGNNLVITFPRLMGMKYVLLLLLTLSSLIMAYVIGQGISLLYLVGIAVTLWLSTLFVCSAPCCRAWKLPNRYLAKCYGQVFADPCFGSICF